MALKDLLKEVQSLRQVVQERQSEVRPKMEQVHQALQEDPRGPIIEMIQEAAGDAESSAREIIDAGGTGGTSPYAAPVPSLYSHMCTYIALHVTRVHVKLVPEANEC